MLGLTTSCQAAPLRGRAPTHLVFAVVGDTASKAHDLRPRSHRRHCHRARARRHWRGARVGARSCACDCGVAGRARGGAAATARAVCAVSRRRRARARRGHRALLPRAAFVHRRERARAAGPWRSGGAATAGRALPAGWARAWRAHCRARRVHAARVPERAARSGAGRSGGRSDRRLHRAGGAQRGPATFRARCISWPMR
jgi:hypothetical protein